MSFDEFKAAVDRMVGHPVVEDASHNGSWVFVNCATEQERRLVRPLCVVRYATVKAFRQRYGRQYSLELRNPLPEVK